MEQHPLPIPICILLAALEEIAADEVHDIVSESGLVRILVFHPSPVPPSNVKFAALPAAKEIVKVSLGDRSKKMDTVRDEIYGLIRDRIEDAEVYSLAPAPPGTIMGAGVDILILLYSAGAIASLANLFWTVYEKLIAPKKPQKSDAGIIVSINPEGDLIFWIGKDYKDKEVFVTVFTEKVLRFWSTDEAKQMSNQYMMEVKSGLWVKVK
ncbi:hypothetical protein M1N59_00905 [Dehalococcoidales bacterium]|nr:hypothetical protein [Dehalococcoidales bacterium]